MENGCRACGEEKEAERTGGALKRKAWVGHGCWPALPGSWGAHHWDHWSPEVLSTTGGIRRKRGLEGSCRQAACEGLHTAAKLQRGIGK